VEKQDAAGRWQRPKETRKEASGQKAKQTGCAGGSVELEEADGLGSECGGVVVVVVVVVKVKVKVTVKRTRGVRQEQQEQQQEQQAAARG
jgi:hypothetical protein